MQIDDTHLKELDTDGYTIVERFLTPAELAAGQAELSGMFPDGATYADDPAAYSDLQTWFGFPMPLQTCNLMAAHPDLLSFCERAMQTPDVLFSEVLVQVRYGAQTTADQPLHMDGSGMNMNAYPRRDNRYRMLICFMYWTDVTLDTAPTYVLPWGRDTRPNRFPSTADPEMSGLEVPCCVSAGSLVIIDSRTFHRGSAMRDPRGMRILQYNAYRPAACAWMKTQGWPTAGQPPAGDDAAFVEFMELASPRQRQAVGFPPPGHDYFDDPETLEGLAMRYPRMDLTPYGGRA